MKAQYIILLVSLAAILVALYFKGAEGFFGTVPSFNCASLTSCSTCGSNSKCNWCKDEGKCYNVDASGAFIDMSGNAITPCSGINQIKTSAACSVILGDLQTAESNIKVSVLNANMNNMNDFSDIVQKDITAAGLVGLDERIKDNVRSVVKDELLKDRQRAAEDVKPSDPDSESTKQGAWYRDAHRDPRDRTQTYSSSCNSGVSDSGPYSDDCDC